MRYASPAAKSAAVDSLDVVILGATQVDTDFNVNVHTDSNGNIMGGSGGHCDTAAGAKLAIVVAPLIRARLPLIVDQVLCKSTPGDTIDVIVTQRGIAVNPKRKELKEKLIKKEGIVADSKSGVTGAGRGLTLLSHYPEINENMVPYKIGNHRHTPEIEQNLTDAAGEPVEIIFTPILAPMNRGILSTIYCDKAEDVTIEKIQNELEEFYKDKPFVDVLPLGQVATVKHVRLSNKCAISVHENKSKIIICSTIDNMVKGSAGQAIQNMNLMLGFDECEGLSTMATAF